MPFQAMMPADREFHDHLREHAVLLVCDAITYLKGQPARPRLGPDTGRTSNLAQRVKAVHPDEHVEVVRHGLRLLLSKPLVPRILVGGFRVAEGGAVRQAEPATLQHTKSPQDALRQRLRPR